MSTSAPIESANSLNRFTHAFRSVVPLLECTMATRLPSGVVTMSISVCKSFRGFSRTTIEKNEVPAEILLVRCATLFVATIPVPASPSGGQSGIPASRLPVGSSFFAPSSVRIPAASPATRTLGRISFIFHG